MKCICKIQPSGKSLRRLLRHVYLPSGRMGREVEPMQATGSRVVSVMNGMIGGLTLKPAPDAQALAGSR
jgi:hypothetical protein